MKLVIYALGRVFEENRKSIVWENVVALCDREITEVEGCDVPVVKPRELPGLEYDLLVIYSPQYFEMIKRELIEVYDVPFSKIICFSKAKNLRREYTWQDVENIRKFCENMKTVLDVHGIFNGWYLSKRQIFKGNDGSLDTVMESNPAVNLYDHVYRKIGRLRKEYHLVIISAQHLVTDAELAHLAGHSQKLLLYVNDLSDIDKIYAYSARLQKYGKVELYSSKTDLYVVLTGKPETHSGEIYVVTHKAYGGIPCEIPYIPLTVGGYVREGWLSEQDGENIAILNDRINECTALYWIWKNTKSDYVGLNHYRRFFYRNEHKIPGNYLDGYDIGNLLDDCDIILPEAILFTDLTVKQQIFENLDQVIAGRGFELVRAKLIEYQPEYAQAFDEVMCGHRFYTCNMFVTKREILNQYCEWLFSFLTEAAENMDASGCEDGYSSRIVGFMAERMWTVWLKKNTYKIKEMPYMEVLITTF